ncbi:MAG: cell division protein FtsA, partial [Pseudomonadota bacterium]
ILTGGASQLHGLRDLAGSILDRPVRIGRPHRVRGLAEAATGPAFSSCAGLLQFIAQQQQKDSTFEAFAAIGAVTRPEDRRGMFGRIGNWLHENF